MTARSTDPKRALTEHRLHRARPLPPQARRDSIIAATLPLLLEHGANVTTRQIASAANVAEGTIFRAFPDKDALIRATVAAALDPTPLLEEIGRLDAEQSLRPRLIALTDVLQRRLVGIFRLLVTAGLDRPPDEVRSRANPRPTNERIYAAISRLIEPDRDRFRVPPREVARLLRLITFSGSHPLITDNDLLSPEQIVSILLDGVCRRTDDPSPAEAPAASDPEVQPC